MTQGRNSLDVTTISGLVLIAKVAASRRILIPCSQIQICSMLLVSTSLHRALEDEVHTLTK